MGGHTQTLISLASVLCRLCHSDHPPAAFFITIRQLLHPSPSSDSDCAGVLLPESYFLLGAGPEPPEPSVTSYN